MYPLLMQKIGKIIPPPLKLKSLKTIKFELDALQKKAGKATALGLNFVVSGAAGTGKTTAIIKQILDNLHNYPPILTEKDSYYIKRDIDPNHKYLKPGIPGVLFLAFTNPAVNVLKRGIDVGEVVMSYVDPVTRQETIRKVSPDDMALTVHKLLEFRPADADTAENLGVTQGTFIPYRNETNKVPYIKTIVFDEVGLLDILLTNRAVRAFDLDRLQLIFIGDICQTGASYGPSTLIRALTKLPIIAFDKVYRFSGILLEFATRINNNSLPTLLETHYVKKETSGKKEWINLGFFTAKEEQNAQLALERTATAIMNLTSNGLMNLYTDLYIIPQKTQAMSGDKIMGEVYSRYDVLYGRPTYYLNTNGNPLIIAVGDPIYYNNKVEIILAIAPNSEYLGSLPQGGHKYPTRDVESWVLFHEKNNDNYVENHLLGTPITKARQLDERLNKADISSAGDDGLGLLSFEDYDDEGDDEDEKATRQLVNDIIVLDVSAITNSLTHLTEASANQQINGFYKELIPLALNHHIVAHATDDHTLHDGTFETLQHVVDGLCNKWNIAVTDVPLRLFTQTSQMQTQYVKYNWRTVQQTQGSQTYSMFLCMHRKAHQTTLTFRENIYTAATRSQCRIFGVMSKALLDGSLPKGGINAQRYPGETVVEKLVKYTKKKRNISLAEIEFDATLDRMIDINKDRLALAKQTANEENADWYDSVSAAENGARGSIANDLPF